MLGFARDPCLRLGCATPLEISELQAVVQATCHNHRSYMPTTLFRAVWAMHSCARGEDVGMPYRSWAKMWHGTQTVECGWGGWNACHDLQQTW